MTRRLLLRGLREIDAAGLHAIISDELVCRFLPLAPSPSLTATEEFISRCRRHTTFSWVLSPIGSTAVCGLLQANESDVGFLLHPGMWGRGLMAEALTAALHWLQPRRAQAICDADNHAAARMLDKAGFRVERRLPAFRVHPACAPAPRDCIHYVR